MLNFTIPKPLYVKVEDYDVKKPVAPKKPASTKPTFPKAGIPENLVPENILPKQRLTNIITELNRDTDSYYNNNATFATNWQENTIIVTKIGNRFWYAIWFDISEEVVFNYSLCVRNLKSLKSYKDGIYFKMFGVLEDDFTSQTHSKKEYLYLSRSVTPLDLENHSYQMVDSFARNYNQPESVTNARSTFIEKLQRFIKVDNRNIFYYYNKSLAIVLGNWAQQYNFHWVPDIDYYLSERQFHPKLKEAVNTPFFKKSINQDISFIVETFREADTREKEALFLKRSTSIKNRLNAINYLLHLYEDEMTLDYLQQVWSGLGPDHNVSYYSYYFSQETLIWFRDNVPVKSFVNMFINSEDQIKDTVSMVYDILRQKPDIDLKYTGRWRPTEFHDFIMSEQWKCNHKNVPLPQDLFPKPVKVDEMTFLQPLDLHFLTKWGRAARNCVGSSTYSDGILKKNHFIILALKENVPYLTIQAKVEAETFKVIQIKKQCNSSLNSLEQEEFSKAFKKALEIRTNELAA
jgi:hypothetical protein